MVSSLILLRSLCVYILKQLFSIILVNSGSRNIYLAILRLGKYLATIYLDFKESLLSIRRSNLLNMMQRLKLAAEHSKHKHPKS